MLLSDCFSRHPELFCAIKLACLLTLRLRPVVVLVYVIPPHWFVNLAEGRPRGFRSTWSQATKEILFERKGQA